MRTIRCLLPTAFCLLSLNAASPVLNQLDPPGGQRGKAITLALNGTGLVEGAAVISSLPGAFTPLAPKENRMGETQLNFLVELKPDAPVGLYPIRVQTPEGLSNVLLFSVGAFPEVAEEELTDYSNDSLETAKPIQPPVTVNGKLRGPDQDFYRFHAKA